MELENQITIIKRQRNFFIITTVSSLILLVTALPISLREAKNIVLNANRDRLIFKDKSHAIFFNEASIDSLLDQTKMDSDRSYSNKSIIEDGILFYFARYNQDAIDALRLEYPNNTYIRDTLKEGQEVLVATSAFRYRASPNDSLRLIDFSKIKPYNIGRLCPNDCPINEPFY